MLKVEALRAELDQTRLRGAPLHHGYGAQHQPHPACARAVPLDTAPGPAPRSP